MIRAMFNLRCSAGHKHYSPTPTLFIGRGCMHTPPGEAKKCELVLARYDNPEAKKVYRDGR